MALKGTLAIDIAQYQRALADAKQSMAAFGLDTSKVNDQIRKMATALDGTKIVAQANQAAVAIQGIGGATALTDKEARRHLATVNEAIAKYKALGQEVPESLSKVARELDGVTTKAQGMGSAAGTALGTFAGYLGAQAITAGLRALSEGFRYVAESAITMNADLERTTLQFQTLMGDADKAQAHVRGLFDFAKRTPFETGPIIAASKSLQVFGGDALNTAENLRLVGDAAAATGAPINEVGFWVGRLYANLASGRPIGEAAQRLTELAVLAPQARNALEDVAKSGASVEEKFRVMQASLSQFSGAMELQAGTWDGVMSSFRDAVQMTIADSLRPLFEAARDTLRELMRLADAGIFDGWALSVSGAVDVAAEKLRAIPRVLSSMSLGFLQLKAEMLELQRDFATMAEDFARKLRETLQVYSRIPGMGQAAFGTAAGLAFGQEVKAGDQAKQLAEAAAQAQEQLAKAQVAAAAYEASVATAGQSSGRAQAPIRTLGDTLRTTGDRALEAAGKVAAYLGVVQALPTAPTFGGIAPSLTAAGGFLPGGFNVAAGIGGAANRGNPFGGLFGGGVFGAPIAPLISRGAVGPGYMQVTDIMGFNGRPLGTGGGGGFNWGQAGAAGLNAAMPFISQLVTGGSRGGQIGGSIGGSLGGAIGSMSSVIGAVGSFAPFIGPIAGILGGLIGRMFGPSRGAILGKEADQRMNQTREGLLQQYGSLDAIRALGPYGSALADAWGSKNVQGEAWFNALNKGLQEQLDLQSQIKSVEEQRKALAESLVPTWEQLTETAGRYGFNVLELGQEIQSIGTLATFKQIAEDLDLFGRATTDVGAYLSRMAGVISVAVQEALRFGTEVPENMRPFIEELAKSGQLLDENGQAITDLSALRWGPAVQTQADLVREAIEKLNETFDNLTAKLDALLDKLANGLPDAAARGARGANGAISTIEGPEHRGGAVDEAGGYAQGGVVYAARGRFIPRGTDTVPAMLSPGEFVMSAAATRRLGVGTLRALNSGAGVRGASQPVVVQVVLDGRVVAESTARHLPDLLPAFGV